MTGVSAPPTAPAPPTTPGRVVNPTLPVSRLAVWSLVLAVIGVILPLVGLLALILGIVAYRRLTRPGVRRTGKGIAVGGIAAGAAGLLVTTVGYGFMAMFMYPALMQTRVQIQTATTHGFMRRGALPLHEHAQQVAKVTGNYPSHVAEFMLREGDDHLGVHGYATATILNGRPVGVRVGAYDLANFDYTEQDKIDLADAIAGLDATRPFYEFGDLWFARLPETHNSSNLVFCWHADPKNNVLFVVTDNGALNRFALSEWDTVWQRDAWAREDLGIAPATPKRPGPPATGPPGAADPGP
ncbi:MAG: DUF4190 domain-containing protein [Planctomycetota bacterium]|jgi:hypothetical protein